MSAKIIYLDGPNGAGKSTIIRQLQNMASKDLGPFTYTRVAFDRQPGAETARLTLGYEALARDPFAALMFYSADRAIQATRWKESGWLEDKDLIIVDRGPLATWAYQGPYFKKKFLLKILNRSMVDLDGYEKYHLVFQPGFEVAYERLTSREEPLSPDQIGELYRLCDWYEQITEKELDQDKYWFLGKFRDIAAQLSVEQVTDQVINQISLILEDN